MPTRNASRASASAQAQTPVTLTLDAIERTALRVIFEERIALYDFGAGAGPADVSEADRARDRTEAAEYRKHVARLDDGVLLVRDLDALSNVIASWFDCDGYRDANYAVIEGASRVGRRLQELDVAAVARRSNGGRQE
jgi:hypothetical protein